LISTLNMPLLNKISAKTPRNNFRSFKTPKMLTAPAKIDF
jgi:hypothetical protein